MSSPETNPQRPASRYRGNRDIIGKSGWTNKVIAALMVVIILALVVAFARFMQSREDSSVTASMAGFERIDDNHFWMDVDVTRDDTSVPSYCIVTALDYSHAEVARREVLIEPGGDATQRMRVDFTTRGPAVSGGIYGCSTTIPYHMNL